jgi:hypothetical protein
MSKSNRTVSERPQSANRSEAALNPAADLVEYIRAYCRKEPEVAALWCLGIGFVLGWKLKLW